MVLKGGWRPRSTAGAIHLALSALFAATVFLAIYVYWYPGVLFDLAGGRRLFLLIAGVDVTLGPLITFIIFVPGKRGLVFDLAVIAFVQMAALTYGVYVLFESRPAYIVFVKDRFELVRANQVPEQLFEEARGSIYDHAPVTGPKLVSARMPRDREEATRIMMSSLGGLDLQFFPRHYAQFNPARGAEIGRLLEGLHRREEDVRFLPMRAGKTLDLTVLLDARSGDVLKIASLKPWAYD
jgi:hypothetical protein